MLFFITLTQACNKNCSYCGAETITDIEDMSPHPRELKYDIEHLSTLAKSKDGLIICFYGGEPTLKPRVMYRVMDLLPPEVKYCLQTNGSLLHRIKTEYINRMDTILVSVDGDSEVTDSCRGKGTYDKCVANCKLLRERGYTGDLVARMTIHEHSKIDRDVLHLLAVGVFDHVHWQLDVLWDSGMETRWKDFHDWRDTIYNPGITALAKAFKDALSKGKVLPIAPFQGLLHSFITGKGMGELRCGSGIDAFNVTTGGIVTACPIAPELDQVASLSADFDPDSVRSTVPIEGLCKECDILNECGGRCLYANKTSWWGEDGFKAVCETVKHLVKEMQELVPLCKELLEAKAFDVEELNYPPFNNSVEVIP